MLSFDTVHRFTDLLIAREAAQQRGAPAVPVLLAVWNLYGTYAREVDQSQLLARVHDVSYCLQEMGDRIEGQLSRGLKMAGSAAAEMRTLVTSARTSLDAISAPVPGPREQDQARLTWEEADSMVGSSTLAEPEGPAR